MNNLITLFAFGTFGNPNGFTHTVFSGNPNLKNSLRTFDLNTNAIKLFKGDKLYSIRKEYIANNFYISYSVYQYAKEPNSNREGSFIGLSVISKNAFIHENLIINVLNDGIENLYSKYVTEGIINVLSSDQFILDPIKDLDKIESNIYKFNLNLNSNSSPPLFIYTHTDQKNLSEVFKKSTRLLNSYDTIYFSQNNEIAEEVIRKGLFELVEKPNFDKKIEQIIELENQRIIDSKNKILNSITELKEIKNKIISQKEESYKKKIELHQKNKTIINHEEKELKELQNNFSSKIRHLENIFQNSTNDQLGEIETIIRGLKNEFREYSNISRTSLESIEKSSNKTREIINPYEGKAPHFEDYSSNNKKTKDGISLSKVFNLLLFFGLIILSYFTYNLYTNNDIKESKILELESILNSKDEVSDAYNLNPYPNSILNNNDIELVYKKLDGKDEIKIGDVVNTIIEVNPNSIGRYYNYQRKDYTSKLYESNEKSFQKNEKGDTIFLKAVGLNNIPCINN